MNRSLADIIESNIHSLKFLNEVKSPNVVVMVCEHCHGEGSLPVTEYKGHTRGLEVEDHECMNCKGSGRLSVEVTIRVKPFIPSKKLTKND